MLLSWNCTLLIPHPIPVPSATPPTPIQFMHSPWSNFQLLGLLSSRHTGTSDIECDTIIITKIYHDDLLSHSCSWACVCNFQTPFLPAFLLSSYFLIPTANWYIQRGIQGCAIEWHLLSSGSRFFSYFCTPPLSEIRLCSLSLSLTSSTPHLGWNHLSAASSPHPIPPSFSKQAKEGGHPHFGEGKTALTVEVRVRGSNPYSP